MKGDRRDLALDPADVAAVRNAKAAGVPVIVVLFSGRPLILEPILDHLDALIAAWLPGSEGDGIADVLFGVTSPTGRLSVTWPKSMADVPMNDDARSPQARSSTTASASLRQEAGLKACATRSLPVAQDFSPASYVLLRELVDRVDEHLDLRAVGRADASPLSCDASWVSACLRPLPDCFSAAPSAVRTAVIRAAASPLLRSS